MAASIADPMQSGLALDELLLEALATLDDVLEEDDALEEDDVLEEGDDAALDEDDVTTIEDVVVLDDSAALDDDVLGELDDVLGELDDVLGELDDVLGELDDVLGAAVDADDEVTEELEDDVDVPATPPSGAAVLDVLDVAVFDEDVAVSLVDVPDDAAPSLVDWLDDVVMALVDWLDDVALALVDVVSLDDAAGDEALDDPLAPVALAVLPLVADSEALPLSLPVGPVLALVAAPLVASLDPGAAALALARPEPLADEARDVPVDSVVSLPFSDGDVPLHAAIVTAVAPRHAPRTMRCAKIRMIES